jgi:molybdenum cofactor cytidylyltransferase
MGQPKALLPWHGGTLLEFQVEQLLAGGMERIILVLGHEAERIRNAVSALPRTTVVLNQDYATGKASSVRVGMEAMPTDADAVLVLSVDQPRPAALIRRVRQAHQAASSLVTVPAFGGRHGHPTIFARPLFSEMRDVTEETQGLRAVRHRHRAETHVVETATAIPLIDINTPEDYQAALANFASLVEAPELPRHPSPRKLFVSFVKSDPSISGLPCLLGDMPAHHGIWRRRAMFPPRIFR